MCSRSWRPSASIRSSRAYRKRLITSGTKSPTGARWFGPPAFQTEDICNGTIGRAARSRGACDGGIGPRRAALAAALAYIRARPEIWEVILTGGDPLIASVRRLREVMRALAAIAHVKIVRVHTRVPVVAPDLITGELVRALRAKGQTTYVV